MKIFYDVGYNEVLDLILSKKIGAIFQGKSESGPRALGNRSIIFDPRVSDGKDIVNIVKKREKFRPFAGSILEEHAEQWFDMLGMKSSPFMTFSLNVRQDKRHFIPAIVHVDGSCRIQTVNQKQNYHYYNLIDKFYQETGVPILLNTSFNLAGKPIVETASNAIKTLHNSEMNYVFFPDVSMMVVK